MDIQSTSEVMDDQTMFSGEADDTSAAIPTLTRRQLRFLECLHRMNETDELEDDGSYCPLFWDQVLCWPLTPAGELAVAPCMDQLGGIFYDTSQNVTRLCRSNGSWAFSNYSNCREIVAHHENDNDDVPYFLGGFCISLLALMIAVWIFLYFKDLRCLRNTIHTNLMVTYIFYDATWIFSAGMQGHVNSVLCTIQSGMIHYLYLTNFFWMFVEGLYLFLLVVMTFTGEKIKLRVYLIIGWGIPAIFATTWGITKILVQDATTTPVQHNITDNSTISKEGLLLQHCPWMASHSLDWIHKAPVIAVLFINLGFLVSIMWVLITKLRSANTAETQQYRKGTKAMLVLFPLLGITYILMLKLPTEDAVGAFFRKTRAMFLSLQGFTVALFYCFLNTEVQNTLRHRVERWKEARALGGGRRYTLSGHSKDWSPRSRTDSIRLGDLHSGGGYPKRESTASASTTTTLLGSNGLPNGPISTNVASNVNCVATPFTSGRVANAPLLEDTPCEDVV